MARAFVSVTNVDAVRITSTRVSRHKDELMIKLSRPWEDLSPQLQSKLFEEAVRLSERHRTLAEDWSAHFYHQVDGEN